MGDFLCMGLLLNFNDKGCLVLLYENKRLFLIQSTSLLSVNLISALCSFNNSAMLTYVMHTCSSICLLETGVKMAHAHTHTHA